MTKDFDVTELENNLHFWMLRGMARRAGLDLTDLLHSNKLPRPKFDEMVRICRNCGHACECLGELSYLPAQLEAPPSFCGNAENLIILHI